MNIYLYIIKHHPKYFQTKLNELFFKIFFHWDQEREEQEQQDEMKRKAYEAEMARLEREAEERNKQRQMEEHEQIKRRHVKERLEELRKTPQGSKILQNIDEEVCFLPNFILFVSEERVFKNFILSLLIVLMMW